MSDPSEAKEEEHGRLPENKSWVSHMIVRCQAGDTASSCAFSDKKGVHQHAYSARIVPPNDNPRSILPVTKFVLFCNMEPVVFDPNVDPEPDSCFNCWSKEHYYKRCTKPKDYDYCCNCGRRNVEIHNCPRCAKGYQELKKNGRKVKPMPPEVTERKKNRRRRRVKKSGPIESKGSKNNSRERRFFPSKIKTGQENSNAQLKDSKGSSDQRKGRWFVPQDVKRGPDNKQPVEFRSYSTNSREKNEFPEASFASDDQDQYKSQNAKWINREEKNSNRSTSTKKPDNMPINNVETLNKKDKNIPSYNMGPINTFSRDFLEVMKAIKHLPQETQNVIALQFLEHGKALIKRDGA